MFLSDRAIRSCIESRRIVVEPWDPAMLQPASIDLRLDNVFKLRTPRIGLPWPEIDPRLTDKMQEMTVEEGGSFVLAPLGFCLASTIEKVTIPADLVARLEGKSSIGRMGITAHVTAGFFDPGFRGHATLEIFNANPAHSVILYPGMKICQMSFATLSSPAERPYGSEGLNSKYQDQQRGPVESQYHRNA